MNIEDNQLEGPALPPVINNVLCSIKEGMGTYEVQWSSEHLEEKYEVTLYRYEEAVTEPIPAYGTTCEISHTVDRDAQYYIGVAPSRNKEAQAKVPVFSDTVISLSKVVLTGAHSFHLEYEFPMSVADEVNVKIENDEKSISRDITLAPYEADIDLSSMGLSGLKEFKLYAGAACIYDKVQVYQSVYDLPPVAVNMEKPVIDMVCLVTSDEENNSTASREEISLILTHKGTGIWADAGAGISLYGMGDMLWSSGISDKTGGCYHFTVKREDLGFGGDISLKLFLQAGILISDVSLPQILHAIVPDCFDVGYIDEDKVILKVKKCLKGFYGYSLMVGEKETEVSFEDGEDIDLLTVSWAPSVRIAYKTGRLRGYYSRPVILQQPAYYVFGQEFPCICMSYTPKLMVENDIVISLQERIRFTEDITGDYFNLLYQDKEGKTKPVLKLDKKVWDFSGGAKRADMKAEYEAFLVEMENKQVGVEAQREIQELISDYLPQSFEEFAYYNYHYESNQIDVFPGIILRAEYSMYQYVGDDEVSVYENGYTGTFYQEALVVCRDGKICMDPFAERLSDGNYVPVIAQPPGGGNLSAFGAAGFLDLQCETMRREYLRLYYPDEFPELDGRGHSEVSYNVGFMASSTREKLASAWKSFRDTGISTQEAPIACFRGRAHVTPCVSVRISGEEKKVPFFTTVGDIIADNSREVKLMRKGKTVYCFQQQAVHWIRNLPLYLGDSVEL